tara:strand:+ start:9944 stop:10963 length:1020 start_codon:yes stop_codon:yes gene_type:complete
MTTFNGHTVINRDNRPSPISPAKLDFLFVKDGSYIDPFQVCSVHIFPNTQFGSPDAYLNLVAGSTDYGLVSSTGSERMVFHNQKTDPASNPVNQVIGFDANISAMPEERDYDSALPNTASGIFRTGPGKFSVILQTGTTFWAPSATVFNVDPPNSNSASGTGGYLDLWTIMDAKGSRAQVYANVFGLTTANVFGSTGPLAVTTNNRLIQRYIDIGSKKNLQIKTELVVSNNTIKESLRNLMETGALVQTPQINITKLNETPGLTSRVQITGKNNVGGFIDSGVQLDANGTISFLWDTNAITPFYESDLLGSPTGVYEVQVKYQLLDETILSPKFKLIVR